jgi:D-beta-D-heptose 7-phosphate kinase/D-beta-D-heptose 1-phosphate adenosyltransferase
MITVIGDYIKDIYVYGNVTRISPESPIPVFNEVSREIKDGGAGNVLNNISALGSSVKKYFSYNSVKTRYVCNNHILFRSDDENYQPTKFKNLDLTDSKICVLSDYNKGALHNSIDIINQCKSKNNFVIVDVKRPLSSYVGSDIVKMNELEYANYADDINDHKKLNEKYNINSMVVTLGKRGCVVMSKEFSGIIKTNEHEVIDVTGAGDVFVSCLAHFMSLGFGLQESCVKANKLASISVTKFGTYVLTEQDIKQCKLVFTNGCFDILHRGHIEYLKRSKEYGNRLIVGLNSDESVKRLKGEKRPINNQYDRKYVLENLGFIDEVIIFDEDTPYELIKYLKPDIITKGGDYTEDTVVGNDLARVVIIPYSENYSTTKIMERIYEKNS